MITINYFRAKDFRTAHSDACPKFTIPLGIHTYKEGKHIIDLPYHTSTRTRLHELGHAYCDHRPQDMTVKELLYREADAESFAHRHMSRQLSWKVLLPAIYDISACGYARTNELFKLCLQYITDNTIAFSKTDKRLLWWEIRHQFLD